MNLVASLLSLFYLLMTSLALHGQDIKIDTALLNHNSWRAKQSWTTTGNMLRRCSFGEFKILSIEKGQRTTVASSKNKGLVFGSDGSRFEKTISSKDTQSYIQYIIAESGDSITLTMALTLLNEDTNTTFNLSKKSPDEAGSSTSFCNQMVVRLSLDTTEWVLKAKEYSLASLTYLPIISSQGDSIFVAYAKGFNPEKKIWNMAPPQGVVFLKNGTQVAALRTVMPVTVWIRNDLDKKSQQVISAIILGLLSYNSQLPQLN